MTSGTAATGRPLGAGGAGDGSMPAPRSVRPRTFALRSLVREARRQERAAIRRGWLDVAQLYGDLADAVEGLEALPPGHGHQTPSRFRTRAASGCRSGVSQTKRGTDR